MQPLTWCKMQKINTQFLKLTAIIACATALAAALYFAFFTNALSHVHLLQWLEDFFTWIESLGIWAQIIFMLIHMAVIVLMLPGVFLTLGAGLIFGFVQGLLLVLCATTMGAFIAFLIGKYAFNDSARNYLRRHPKLKLINEELVEQGTVFIFLTRLVPFFPFKLSNYFFGIAGFSSKDFLLGTALGIIPISCINVYLGSVAADFHAAFIGQKTTFFSSWWAIALVSLVAVAVMVFIKIHAQKALLRYAMSHGAEQQTIAPNSSANTSTTEDKP